MLKNVVIVILLLSALPYQPATAQLACQEDSHPDCADDKILNGYWWKKAAYPVWVPFFPSLESWFLTTPVWTKGVALYYEPGPMRATAKARGLDLTGYKGGVALMSPSDIGQDVWLKRPGHDWEGRYKVVDAASWNDIYAQNLHFDEVIEVDWHTAVEWGLVSPSGKKYLWKLEDVEVSKIPPEQLDGCPIDYPKWWRDHAEPAEKNVFLQTPYYRSPRDWYLDGQWTTYTSPIQADLVNEQSLYQNYLSCEPAVMLDY